MKSRAFVITSVVLIAASASACASRPKPAVIDPPPAAGGSEGLAPASPTGAAPAVDTDGVTGSIGASASDLQRELTEAAGADRVYFGFDSSALSPGAQATLRAQAAWLAAHPGVRVLIAGNADERGTREYNIALGARRAAAVKSYLVALGVAQSRIATVSYGKERPIDPRSNEEGWARNRNAHTQAVTITTVG